MKKTAAKESIDTPLTIKLGKEELVIRRRYEVLSIANDFLIAIWFLVGSILFLFPSFEKAGVWMFIIGSFQFLVRPAIRLAGNIHLQRIPESRWES
ncbi:MAG: YrhK family protein [Desulfobacteraceae bacterium]|nr:YrhK family protein [Desulfobacteraceae bacterium]